MRNRLLLLTLALVAGCGSLTDPKPTKGVLIRNYLFVGLEVSVDGEPVGLVAANDLVTLMVPESATALTINPVNLRQPDGVELEDDLGPATYPITPGRELAVDNIRDGVTYMLPIITNQLGAEREIATGIEQPWEIRCLARIAAGGTRMLGYFRFTNRLLAVQSPSSNCNGAGVYYPDWQLADRIAQRSGALVLTLR